MYGDFTASMQEDKFRGVS